MRNFLSKYVGIVLFIATMMGSFHHHHDAQQHNDCQVCTVQSTIFDADTPEKSVYLSELDIFHEGIVTPLFSLHSNQLISNVNPRAPPKIS
ncbi:hypothetical protein [Sulfurimonas marina]|uniref:Uncharacterized protein n=1 Tax=Sulfurimonas marina TaxID=2590551 RepID=A0A7M1AVS5_9BACT|nr:hypothetical protein [Sulfurimonas marina]QOP41520.1 hypothetical protein FJR03_07090 [Sulfurimonas marina]